ncbi:MAG: hypothetical protein AAGD47_04590, partial [Pseudomonadota bacterium]
ILIAPGFRTDMGADGIIDPENVNPFSHLYGYYFPDFFKVPSKQDTYLSEWINIFRVDDPIGTHIGAKARRDQDAWPVEVPIPPGGHTYYWLEPEVRQVLHRVISPELAERVSLMPERPSDEVEA